jgi:putative hemolysin
MNKKLNFILFLPVSALIFTSCTPVPASPSPQADLANPASVFCEQQGNRLEIRTASDGSQTGVCVFPSGIECEEWAYYRGECKPIDLPVVETPSDVPPEFPTPAPLDPAGYEGWWKYSHPTYGFSLLLPFDWIVEDVTMNDPLMNGHALLLRPEHDGGDGLQVRMTLRRTGEDYLLWPTGVGAGQFVSQGTLDAAGGLVRRALLVCPTGQVDNIWYQGTDEANANIQRGDLEFGFIAFLAGYTCQEGHSLSGKIQYVSDMIVASLSLP